MNLFSKKSYNLVFIRDTVLFPNLFVELFLGNEKCIRAVEDKNVQDEIVVVTQKNLDKNYPESGDFFGVGILGKIAEISKVFGKTKILLEPQKRVTIEEYSSTEPYFSVITKDVRDDTSKNNEVDALMNIINENTKQLINLGKPIPIEITLKLLSLKKPNETVNILTPLLDGGIEEKQRILETVDIIARLKLVRNLLNKTLSIFQIERNVVEKTEEEITKSQKELYLREEMKTIQKELGESDGSDNDNYRLRIEKSGMPEEIKSLAYSQLSHLQKTPAFSPEVSMIRSYLDLLVDLPWKIEDKNEINITEARRILDQDHFGLEKVKQRILEYLAIKKLSKSSLGTILCFVGPPGTGKTSIGRSIARSIGRKFVGISLGGIRDEAEIRGHRRTYIGAMPGRIIQGIRNSRVKNPVFMLDEIDKLGTDFRGDPSSALLEALDPEQNSHFSDHYLEVQYDLSNVIFITTANLAENIPPPLRDRLEIIDFSSYTPEEKIHIAKDFIWPKVEKNSGINFLEINISDKVYEKIIDNYTDEPGVRELERTLSKIARKVAYEYADGGVPVKIINEDNLNKYLGVPTLYKWEKEQSDQVGTIAGLAVTNIGGQVLSIEAMIIPDGRGNLTLTGNLGDVMKESAEIALSYIRTIGPKFSLDTKLFQQNDIHIHVPLGSVPKDGPSAGAAMAMAIFSAFAKQKIKSDVGITGEISLSGRILRVGGIKEKIIAAKRSGLKSVFLPLQNKTDIELIETTVTKNINIKYVEKIDEALDAVFFEEKLV